MARRLCGHAIAARAPGIVCYRPPPTQMLGQSRSSFSVNLACPSPSRLLRWRAVSSARPLLTRTNLTGAGFVGSSTTTASGRLARSLASSRRAAEARSASSERLSLRPKQASRFATDIPESGLMSPPRFLPFSAAAARRTAVFRRVSPSRRHGCSVLAAFGRLLLGSLLEAVIASRASPAAQGEE